MANNALTLSQLNRYVSLLTSGGVSRDALLAAFDAASTGYTPQDDLDWSIPPPTTVAQALDELALIARFGSQAVTGISGTGTFTADFPPALTPVKSGRFLMCQQAGGNVNTGVSPLVAQLRVDGANVANATASQTLSGASTWTNVTFAVLNLNRTVQHSLGIQYSVGAATLSNGFARWFWIEA